MFFVILYYLYNLKNGKNTHGGLLLACNCTKSSNQSLMWSSFINFTNDTKSRKASHKHLFSKVITGKFYPKHQGFFQDLFSYKETDTCSTHELLQCDCLEEQEGKVTSSTISMIHFIILQKVCQCQVKNVESK